MYNIKGAGTGKFIPPNGLVYLPPFDMTTLILGADVSLTSTGLAVVLFEARRKPRLISHRVIKTTPKETPAQRLDAIRRGSMSFAKEHRVKKAGVETGLVYRGRNTTLALAQARGACLVGLHMGGVKDIIDVNPSAAKAAATTARPADKEAVMKGVAKRVSYPANTSLIHDEADAVAMTLVVHANPSSS